MGARSEDKVENMEAEEGERGRKRGERGAKDGGAGEEDQTEEKAEARRRDL